MSKYKYKMYQLSGPLMTSGAGSSKSGTIIVDCSQEQCNGSQPGPSSGHGNLPLFSSYLWQVTASFLGQQQPGTTVIVGGFTPAQLALIYNCRHRDKKIRGR